MKKLKICDIIYKYINFFRLGKEILMTDIIKLLKCPVCGEKLTLGNEGHSLLCRSIKKRHCFDLAKSGYVNFAGSSGGDPKEAVTARRRFLSLGHYEPAAKKLSELLRKYAEGETVADTGCGEGYYGKYISDGGNPLIGFDLSKPAVEAAAKLKLPNSFFAVAGINAMPLADESVGAVTNVFAPCFEDEFCRVLKKSGVLILVGAGPLHLMGLKKAIYDETPLNTERADLPQNMRLIEKNRVSYEITLDGKEAIGDLFSMTPYSFRTSKESYERLLALDTLKTDVEFDFYVYKKD